MQEVDNILKHFGVRGMHWGVRRSKAELSGPTPVVLKIKPGEKVVAKGGKRQPTAEDAINAAVLKQRAKASGSQALSNQDLQQVINRMNLEQSYSKLNPKKLTFGQKATEELLYGSTPNLAVAAVTPLLKDSTDPRKVKGLAVATAIVAARPKKVKK